MRREQFNSTRRYLATSCLAACLAAAPFDEPSAADEAGKMKPATIALSDAAPEIYFALRRNSPFYGDINTVHGAGWGST